jgi:hypothetical protein
METKDMEREMDELTTKQIIALIAEFHAQTGIPVNDIIIFYKKLSAINTQFAVNVLKEELRKI